MTLQRADMYYESVQVSKAVLRCGSRSVKPCGQVSLTSFSKPPLNGKHVFTSIVWKKTALKMCQRGLQSTIKNALLRRCRVSDLSKQAEQTIETC